MATEYFSASVYLTGLDEPTYDRFDEDESEDELRCSTDSCSQYQTLDDLPFHISPNGALVLEGDLQDGKAVWMPNKVANGAISPSATASNECSICLLDFDEPSALVTTQCNHTYCRDCMASYLRYQIGDINTLEHTRSSLTKDARGDFRLRVEHTCGVVCPNPTCNALIEGSPLQDMCDAETWKRFTNLTNLLHLRRLHKDALIDACPRGCGGYIQSESCACTTPGCAERAARSLNKAATRAARRERQMRDLSKAQINEHARALFRTMIRRRLARPCPKCGFLIFKDGGCDHMNCRACGLRYNWSESSVQNSSHLRTWLSARR